ncbi:MAG: ABC transporter substrate-binding protein [Methanocorpusculum sp.]|nr:ABC transporter substrate-binding protein [Methanocorpusculum sp.]
MNRYVLSAVILALTAVMVTAGCVSEDVQKKTYIVGVDSAYPPFTYMQNGEFTGFDIDSVRWIAESEGFKVVIRPIAWYGAVTLLTSGKIDMVYSGMVMNEERAARVAFSDVYWTTGIGIAVNNGSSVLRDDVADGRVRVGVERGCSSDMWLKNHLGAERYAQKVADGSIQTYDTFPASIDGLKAGEVDAVIFIEVVVREYVRNDPATVLLDTIQTNDSFAVAVRKDDTKLLSQMNAGLAKLKGSEKWDELMEKYFG